MDASFDALVVWNRHMKDEAVRIYGLSADRVATAGAIQMDFYSWPGIVEEKAVFLNRHGLKPGRPIILFAGGAQHIAPLETDHLCDLDLIVGEFPPHQRPQILFRPHPVDVISRWVEPLSRCTNVVLAPSWMVTNQAEGRINVEDIRSLATMLAHTDLHVSTSSTMSLDGAVFDKPQIGLAYDESTPERLRICMEELYQRDHYRPLTTSGAIRIVRSRAEFRAGVRSLLADPSQGRRERAAMVLDVCGAPVGSAVTNVANAVARFALETRVDKQRLTQMVQAT
jgi:hypothetical protein